MTIALNQLNDLENQLFIQTLAEIYEHSPWVAEGIAEQRPFSSIEDLHQSMAQCVAKQSDEQKLILIRNHPELAGKAAKTGNLTESSTNEQKGAGLDQCSTSELAEINTLNKQYSEKFKFPFIIAVSGLNRWQIIEQMKLRLSNDLSTEFATCLKQIDKIALIRLEQLITE